MEIQCGLMKLVISDSFRRKYSTTEELSNAIQAVLEKEAEDLQIELQELEKIMDERKKLGGLTWPFDMNISFSLHL